MARRGHGEGSIYKRKDGRYAAAFTLENRKRKYFYGKTRKEVQEHLKVALHEQQQGTLALGPKQTVKQFLEHWLEEVHRPNIRQGSYVRYRTNLKYHISSYWRCAIATAYFTTSTVSLLAKDERGAVSKLYSFHTRAASRGVRSSSEVEAHFNEPV